MRASLLVCLIAVVTACSKSSTAPKAGPYDCAGTAFPTTAPATITISGVVADLINGPLAGAQVSAYQNGTGLIDTTTTDAQGKFAFTVSTGGTPLDGYVKASKTGYIDTYAYPSAPLPANTSITVSIVTPGEFSLLATQAGVTPVSGKGSLAVRPVDCTETVVPTATVSTSPSAALYGDGSGDFFAFNLAPGSVQVNAQYQSHVFHGHSVTAVADAVTITIAAPGPVSPPE